MARPIRSRATVPRLAAIFAVVVAFASAAVAQDVGTASAAGVASRTDARGRPEKATPPERKGMITFRFREHFDVSQIRWGDLGIDQGYWGATNTVNLWWEVPGRYAIGLAFMPVLTRGYRSLDGFDPRFDTDVKLWNFGIEGKYHLPKWGGFGPFVRGGLYGSRLEIDDFFGGDRWGGSYYAAFGGEVPIWDERIGVAVDLGFRHSILEKDTQVLSFTPSVAVALYFISDWLGGLR